MQQQKKKRGFAAMSPEKQRQIASKGGKMAHQKGTAHEFTPEKAAEAGRKGGLMRGKNWLEKQERLQAAVDVNEAGELNDRG